MANKLVNGFNVETTPDDDAQRAIDQQQFADELAALLARQQLEAPVRARMNQIATTIGDTNDYTESVYWLLRALVLAVKDGDTAALNALAAKMQLAEQSHPAP